MVPEWLTAIGINEGEERSLNPSTYSATETLRDGQTVEIRALSPDDRSGLLEAVGRSSEQSLYRRFFVYKRSFTDKEIDYFVNIDFKSHVALVAVLEENGRSIIVGGARYVLTQYGLAEVAFAVDDSHQAKGIGAALMRHLSAIAQDSGVTELVAEILPENGAMLKVFEKCGRKVAIKRDMRAIRVVVQLT
jgi:RimJ/RimL family protein N-acetyltransferase